MLKNLRQLRIAAGLTQEELAKMAGICARTIARAEAANKWPARANDKKAIIKAFASRNLAAE